LADYGREKIYWQIGCFFCHVCNINIVNSKLMRQIRNSNRLTTNDCAHATVREADVHYAACSSGKIDSHRKTYETHFLKSLQISPQTSYRMKLYF